MFSRMQRSVFCVFSFFKAEGVRWLKRTKRRLNSENVRMLQRNMTLQNAATFKNRCVCLGTDEEAEGLSWLGRRTDGVQKSDPWPPGTRLHRHDAREVATGRNCGPSLQTLRDNTQPLSGLPRTHRGQRKPPHARRPRRCPLARTETAEPCAAPVPERTDAKATLGL